jgi:mannose-6-phosphate isomerase-like protein (cupin superfamily)
MTAQEETTLDRRSFTQMLPALLAAVAALPQAHAQQAAAPQDKGTMDHPVMGSPTPGPPNGNKPKGAVTLPDVVSGVYTPGGSYGSLSLRTSHRYVLGMLKAGNIQLEIHETIQEPGAAHEPTDKHLHNEIWLVREGTCELTINGVTRRMEAGDIGIVTAGDLHYVRNAGTGRCAYFVVTLGAPEQYT